MEQTNESCNLRLVSELDLNEKFRDFIELLNDNYLTNFPNSDDLSDFALSSFNNMKKFAHDDNTLILGAYKGEKVIGFLWAYRRMFLGKAKLHISHIVVKSSYRGVGIGTKMIDYLVKYASKRDIKIIELLATSENNSTIAFYKKHGFVVTRVQLEKSLGDNNDN